VYAIRREGKGPVIASIRKFPGRKKPFGVAWREPGTKTQRWRYFATKREADTFRDTVGTEIRQGTYVDQRPIPFKMFSTDWLARTKPTVSANTHSLHEWAVNGYLIPAFNMMAIQALRPDRIERWQAALLSQGKPGPRSVQIIRGVLHTILEDGVAKGVIFASPLARVRRFEVPERELKYLDVPQLKLLCEKVGSFYAALFLIMAFAGLRVGEATGLQWSDLDLDRRRLWVRRQAIWRRKKNCPPGEPRWTLAEPKPRAGKRVVEIPVGLSPLLIAHRESLNGSNPLNLVFPSQTGTPLYPKNIRRRHFLPALQALGIVGIRQHDFRRTFIALHVEAGTHPKLVQERVGHSSIGLTMDLYGKIAGQMALSTEQEARLEALAAKALPESVPVEPTTNSVTETPTEPDRTLAKTSDSESTP
jgi:integrase